MAGDGAHVGAVHANGAFVYVIKAHEQVDERGLAAARGADDGHPLTGPDGKAQIPDEGLCRVIAEGDVLKLDLAGRVRQHPGVRRVGALRGLIQQFKDPGGAGKRVLQLGHDAADLVEGLGVLVGVAQKRGQAAHGEGRGGAGGRHADQGARQGDGCIDQVVDKAGAGVGQGGVEHRLSRGLLKPVVDLVKGRDPGRFAAEGLDHLLAAQHFVNKGGLLGPGLALGAEEVIGVRGDIPGHHKAQGREQHHDQGDPGLDGHHKAQRAENGHDARKQLGKAQKQAVCKLVYVGNEAADNAAHGLAVEIRQRKLLQMGKGPVAHVAHHAEGDLVVDGGHDPAEHRGCADHQGDAAQKPTDGGKVHLPGAHDMVDGPAKQNRHVERQRHRHSRQEDGEQRRGQIGPQAGQDLAQNGAVGGVFRFLHARSSFLNCES